MSYPLVELGELIRANYGKALKQQERDDTGPWGVYGSSGFVGKHSKTLTKKPTIIIGRKGSVGAITYAANGGWTIDTAFYVERLDDKKLDLRFLYYALKNAGLDKHTITTSIPGISRDNIYGTQIPLPPLPEQRRIAAILDKADAIRRKRQEAIRLAEDFLRSVFLDMFGDPVTNPKGWEVGTIESLLSEKRNAIRTGPFGSQLKVSEFVNEGVPVLGIDNVVTNEFKWTIQRCLPHEKYEEFKRYQVFPDDVIVTIMGTTGRVAVAPKNLPKCMSTKHLCVFTLNKKVADPVFIWATLMFDQVVRNQAKIAGGGAIMEGWNLGIIKSLMVRVPPIELQLKFRSTIEQIKIVRARETTADNIERDLLSSLVQRAFRGDL